MSSAGSTGAAYRDWMNRLEDAVRKSLVEKVAHVLQYVPEVSRQSTLSSYREEADRLLQEMMNALHHHTSGLLNEEAVNAVLQEQKDFIIQNITNIRIQVKNTVDGQNAEHFFIRICNMAVCQWKIQRDALMNLSPKQ